MKTPYLDEMIEELRILRTQNSLTKYAFNLLYELEEIKRALSLGGVVGQSEQLPICQCENTERIDVGGGGWVIHCKDCGKNW